MKFFITAFSFIVSTVFFYGCKEPTYPRPRGYHRIIFPQKSYSVFDTAGYPFTFEYPKYGKITKMKLSRDSLRLNVFFPEMKAEWFITGRFFDGKKTTFEYSYEDYRKLVYKHTQKGMVEEFPIDNGSDKRGVFYSLNGDVATTAAFFVSDSARYALSGSLYFETALKNDSLAPVIAFLKGDMQHLIKSLKWR